MNECDQGSQLCSLLLKAFRTRKLPARLRQPPPVPPPPPGGCRVPCGGEWDAERSRPAACVASGFWTALQSRCCRDRFMQVTDSALEAEGTPTPAGSSDGQRRMLKGWAWGRGLRLGQEPVPFPDVGLQLPARRICLCVPEALPSLYLLYFLLPPRSPVVMSLHPLARARH